MRKRILSIGLAFVMVCLLSACNKPTEAPNQENPPDETETVTLYTVGENTIAIPNEWGKEVVVNPDDNFYLTPQTLFALFCEDAFSDLENELGWIVSICYYTEDEYQEMYLESPSKQYVFARDNLGYYCVLLPTDIQTDDPVLNDFMENIRKNEIQEVVRDMISRNNLEAYKENESDKPYILGTVSNIDAPEEAAKALAENYLNSLMVADESRTYTITKYRNLDVALYPTTEMDAETVSIYFLQPEEIGDNTWIMEIEVEFQFEGTFSPIGSAENQWISGLHQGSPVGYLVVKENNEYQMISRD